MHIESLKLTGFRNINQAHLDFDAAFNVFYGENAQGKTNVVEALYLCGMFQSFRTERRRELIGWDHEQALLECRYHSQGLAYRLGMALQGRERRLSMNGQNVERLKDVLGTMRLVLFTVEDTRITRGGPDERRRFMDRALFMGDPSFLETAQTYQRLLKQRNRLLKESYLFDPILDESLREQLAQSATQLVEQRLGFLHALEPLVKEGVRIISQGNEDVRLAYRSHPRLEWSSLDGFESEAYKQALQDKLAERVISDRERGFTGSGPHTDDLDVFINEVSARKFASQGQHRTVVLALKLAELDWITRQSGQQPVLFLDDLSSELDDLRRRRLFTHLGEVKGQVFLTSTDPHRDLISTGQPVRRFRVEAGQYHQED